MSASTGIKTVLLIAAVGAVAISLSGPDSSGPVWLIVLCATALPAIASVGAYRKARRVGGREGVAWRILAVSMAFMVPIYGAEYFGAFGLENILISVAYILGGVAVIVVPLPNAGPYQRIVASLDALGIGILVATGSFLVVSGSNVDVTGHAVWAISDSSIMAMIGYVAVRRSQRRGADIPLLALLTGVGAYLLGVLLSSVGSTPYHLGHVSDYAYMLGMMSFAASPLARENTEERSAQILRPVRWRHVLSPYALVVVLAVLLAVHEFTHWREDETGAVIVGGIVIAMLLVLVRQVAMIAEQRHKIDLEQSGVIATVSHELRTPLTTVVGFLDLLEDWHHFSDDEKVEMVRLMRGQSHVMARVVGDLVSVAREEIEQLEVSVTNIEVSDLLTAAAELVPELDSATLTSTVHDPTPLTADRERMLQILTNYLSNAAKYGSGRIHVAAFVESGATVIEVHDDGPGVPDIFRLVIWERFERGPQRQGAIPGSGIGLSVARGIARSHGGESQYRRSEILGGACFSIRIPLANSPWDRTETDASAATA